MPVISCLFLNVGPQLIDGAPFIDSCLATLWHDDEGLEESFGVSADELEGLSLERQADTMEGLVQRPRLASSSRVLAKRK